MRSTESHSSAFIFLCSFAGPEASLPKLRSRRRRSACVGSNAAPPVLRCFSAASASARVDEDVRRWRAGALNHRRCQLSGAAALLLLLPVL